MFVEGAFSSVDARTPDWRVCIYDFAGVNEPTLASMQVELSELLYPGRVSLEPAPCLPASGRVIYLLLREAGPSKDGCVLGRAAVTRGRIMPMIEVFLKPVLGLIGDARSASKVGRALARVAAHEVTHYVSQQTHHAHDGLMRSVFSGRELGEDDSYPFLER